MQSAWFLTEPGKSLGGMRLPGPHSVGATNTGFCTPGLTRKRHTLSFLFSGTTSCALQEPQWTGSRLLGPQLNHHFLAVTPQCLLFVYSASPAWIMGHRFEDWVEIRRLLHFPLAFQEVFFLYVQFLRLLVKLSSLQILNHLAKSYKGLIAN